jgi:hypothetical protein
MKPEAPPVPQRQFKGVWICAALWVHPDLTPTEKCLIAEIDSLCGDREPCFAGNDYLAKHLRLSPAHMRDTLAKLTGLGYLIRLAFTGRRTLRCVCPELSSDPLASKVLIKRYQLHGSRDHNGFKIPRPEARYRVNPIPEPSYRVNPIAGIGQIRQQTSDISDTEISNRDTSRETTTRSGSRSPAKNGNGADHPPVVVASFFVSEEDKPEDVLDKLTEKFGLSKPQRRLVTEHFDQEGGLGYVIEKAKIVLSKPRKNAGGAFEKALRDDWKAPKASESVRRRKVPAVQEIAKELSDEEWSRQRAAIAEVKSALQTS